jgi:hypothetical protein
MFSAGQGSFRAAKIDQLLHPEASHRLVFTDVLYEDADAYRFLIEAAANIYGRSVPWVPAAEDFPDYRVDASVPIEDYAGNPDWRRFLSQLKDRAAETLPELIWLVEGRDPWETFRDERFLGNSRVDPCSKFGKRETLDRWRKANCDPANDVFLVGIGEHERHRFAGGRGAAGIRARMAETGWAYEAPLIAADEAISNAGPRALPSGALRILYDPLEDLGLRTPRLYGLGYVHNNCGGFCVKAGHAHYQNRLKVQPERFAYDAIMEEKLRVYLGADVSMLTDRSGGLGKRPMTLDAFARRLIADPAAKYEYEPGSSGCGCMIDPG